MGIYDRDYMRRDTNKKEEKPKEKHSWGNESSARKTGPRPEQGTTRKQSEPLRTKPSPAPDLRKSMADVEEAEWWDGQRWIKGNVFPAENTRKPMVRPWLLQLFLFILVTYGTHTAIQNYRKDKQQEEMEKLSKQWAEISRLQAEQRELEEKASKAYKSPYAAKPQPIEVRNNDYESRQEVGPIQAPVRPPSTVISNGITVLEASSDGHYFTSGTVNGFPVVFLVDTGATSVSVNTETAMRAGIRQCTPIKFSTANGQVMGCKAMVPSITFGDYTVSNVEVSIIKDMPGHSLLGMNVLKMFTLRQSNNKLLFTPNQ